MIKMNKVKRDLAALEAMTDGHFKDWLGAPWNTHHWTDMFVESSRHAPYLMGHVWAVYFPASIIAIVWLALS